MVKISEGNTKSMKNGKNLPSELTEEFLSRITAVKDVLRCRSVCKPWKTLIDSNEFKKKLFQSAKLSHSTLFIWRKSFSLEPTLHSLIPPFNSVSPSLALNLSQFQDDSSFDGMISLSGCVCSNLDFKKFGVVNGLVCLSWWNYFHVVWNPTTKEFKGFNAPKKNWVFDMLDNCGITDDILLNDDVSAFGYDPNEQDFKFLIAHFTSALTNSKKNSNKVLFQVYSLKNKAWRGVVFDFPFISRVVTGDGFMDDGKFYWFVKKCGEKRDDGGFSPAVLCFDFCNEVFELITLPVVLASGEDAVVVANRGVLEIIMTFDDGRDDECLRCEVWVMENGGSWRRTLKFDLACQVERPIGVMKDGDIMFEKPSNVDGVKELVLINPATGLCKNELDFNGTDFWMFNYVQSLFSVKQ